MKVWQFFRSPSVPWTEKAIGALFIVTFLYLLVTRLFLGWT